MVIAARTTATSASVSARRHPQHRAGDRAGAGDHRHRHREDADVLGLGRALDLFGALLAALGPALEHHVEGDEEQHDAAGDAEAGEADAERREASAGRASAKNIRIAQAISDERIAIARRCAAVAAARQAGEDRRAARRIDDHQEGDQRRAEQFDHCARGADVVDEHLRVARPVHWIDTEVAVALVVDPPIPAQRAVGGLAAAVIGGRGPRLRSVSGGGGADRRSPRLARAGGAMHARLERRCGAPSVSGPPPS